MAGYPGFSPYGPLAMERGGQIDELLRAFPSAKAINPDRSVFDLPVELRDKKTTALRVSLAPHFPQDRPGLSVLLPVAHPSVDPAGRLHTPRVAAWVYGSSRLVDVVREALTLLAEGATADTRQPGSSSAGSGAAAYPPPGLGLGPMGAARPNLPTSPTRSGAGTGAAAAAGQPPGVPGGAPSLLPATAAPPDLMALPTAQLEQLLSDEAAFKAYLRGVLSRSTVASTLEDIRVKNRQLASSNMGRQEDISEVRNQLAVVKSSEYTAIKDTFDALQRRQAAVLDALGGGAFREALEVAVAGADADASAVATSFLAGALPLEEFLERYLEASTKQHMLDLKRQAAQQLL